MKNYSLIEQRIHCPFSLTDKAQASGAWDGSSILPRGIKNKLYHSSSEAKDANQYVDVKIPTGLGYARNILVVRASDAIVAINGENGTLSEIAFGLDEEKIIVGIETWQIKGVKKVNSAQEAVNYIKKKVKNAK